MCRHICTYKRQTANYILFTVDTTWVLMSYYIRDGNQKSAITSSNQTEETNQGGATNTNSTNHATTAVECLWITLPSTAITVEPIAGELNDSTIVL